MRKYVTHEHEEKKVVLKIDFKNAFNSLRRRDVILSKVKEHVPSLYKMAWQAYSKESNLYFNGTDVIGSKEGIQQGDPLGPFYFALGILSLMKSMKSEVNIWYLDDASLCGSPEEVREDFDRIRLSRPRGQCKKV